MGTNYYLYQSMCPTCGRGYEPLHIGKSSTGWCFSLHIIPEQGISDLEDWEHLWNTEGAIIQNEYNHPISPEDMKAIITKRSFDYDWPTDPFFGYSSWEEFHRLNSSEPGPNELMRHRLDNECIKHGEGTWDYIIGEFS